MMALLYTGALKGCVLNVLGTVVFVCSGGQLVAMLLVNYKGGPWMKGVTENFVRGARGYERTLTNNSEH